MSTPRRDRAVVVTGAASGIGRGLALELHRQGWGVVAVDRDEDGLDRLTEDAEVTPVVGDVTIADTHDRAVRAAPAPLVGWVNNAGIAASGSVDTVDGDDVAALLAVNLTGTVLGCGAAVRAMSGGGSIVNISSTQAIRGTPGYPAYAASKGGILSLTTQVAAEFAPRGLRCNAVLPGVIETEMNRRILAEADDPARLRATWDRLCPIGRLGTVDDVAQLAAFLLDDRAGFITGAQILVDGGQSAVVPTWGAQP